jgi:hypothetical protein
MIVCVYMYIYITFVHEFMWKKGQAPKLYNKRCACAHTYIYTYICILYMFQSRYQNAFVFLHNMHMTCVYDIYTYICILYIRSSLGTYIHAYTCTHTHTHARSTCSSLSTYIHICYMLRCSFGDAITRNLEKMADLKAKRARLREAFQRVDVDRSGNITAEELWICMQELGYEFSKEEVWCVDICMYGTMC